MERGTVLIETAFKKLTGQAWKVFKQDDTGKVSENGVQLLIKHDEWADIITAIYKATKDGGE